uniref:NADH-ubiquinone oxidoreductase chain 4L n=1 Tax=Caridina gracilipes TaxID=859806 RepID=A0A0U1X559_9EUCA|nr:NADH dehydrogenase subunit 4L [Caridina gracilipes]AIJ50615.1 NADH dehydrogenase subunit 4L [Caridina gracilipes]
MVALSMSVMVVPIVMLVSGVSSFVGRSKHLLSTLLSLEYIMLSVFLLMVMLTGFLGSDGYFVLFFLTLAACEGALGLALLVSVVRTHGNDNFSSFVSLEC